MATLPKIMLRVQPEHQPLIRAVAARLTADSGFAATLEALLGGPTSAPGLTSTAEMAALAARVATLEATMAEVREILRALLEELSGHRHDPLHPRSSLHPVEFLGGPAS